MNNEYGEYLTQRGKGNKMGNMSQNLRIHAGFPGGNIVVEEYLADSIKLRPDLSMCSTWWFWWYFEAENLTSSPFTVRFVFTEGSPLGSAGPCVNINRSHWHWLGRECVEENIFEFRFTPEMRTCRFAFAIPYVQDNLECFLRARPDIDRSILTRSAENRAVELLHIPSKTGKYAVFITARHHACESVASYVLEGILDARRQNRGRLAQEVDFYAVPFMDVDGVENGDQGKNRPPHDHNRDYGQFIYSSTAALAELLKRNRPRTLLLLDLHCPYYNETDIFWVESPLDSRLDQLRDLLRESALGHLRYDGKHDIPFGINWNNDPANDKCSRYAQAELQIADAFTLEIPYAEAGGVRINEDRAAAFGHDLCRAIENFTVKNI